MHRDSATVLKFLELAVGRLGHLETLLMGLATVGLAGWGFIHSTDYLDRAQGPILFAILFSGLIACAYSMIYVARMAINVVLLGLEKDLGGPVNPYRGYFQAVGKVRARLVYYLTASFVPALALGSLVLTVSQALLPASKLRGIGFLWALWVVVSLCVLVAAVTSLHYIERTMFRMSDLGLAGSEQEET